MEWAKVPSAVLQPFAIEALGELCVGAAVPILEEVVEWDGDSNLTVLAKNALAEIARISAAESSEPRTGGGKGQDE